MYIDMCSYQNDKKTLVSEKSRLNQHMTSHLQKDVSLKEVTPGLCTKPNFSGYERMDGGQF